ncbi:MAG: hypothetical protein IJ773_11300 [Lachnospiraceae bacterium]|nr:hypothetical protein [Lachnospiraceae bacterium]
MHTPESVSNDCYTGKRARIEEIPRPQLNFPGFHTGKRARIEKISRPQLNFPDFHAGERARIKEIPIEE